MKITGTAVLAIVGVAGLVLLALRAVPGLKAAAAKINPASRDNAAYQATGEWGTYIPDLFGGVFKSDAEKQVDVMLKPPAATKKTVITPASSGYEHSPGSFESAKGAPVQAGTTDRYGGYRNIP